MPCAPGDMVKANVEKQKKIRWKEPGKSECPETCPLPEKQRTDQCKASKTICSKFQTKYLIQYYFHPIKIIQAAANSDTRMLPEPCPAPASSIQVTNSVAKGLSVSTDPLF